MLIEGDHGSRFEHTKPAHFWLVHLWRPRHGLQPVRLQNHLIHQYQHCHLHSHQHQLLDYHHHVQVPRYAGRCLQLRTCSLHEGLQQHTSCSVFHIQFLYSTFHILYFAFCYCRRRPLFTWWPKSALTGRASRCHFISIHH